MRTGDIAISIYNITIGNTWNFFSIGGYLLKHSIYFRLLLDD